MSHEFFRRARAKYFGKVQETKTVADAWQHNNWAHLHNDSVMMDSITMVCIMSTLSTASLLLITLAWCHLVSLVTDGAHLTSIHNQVFTAHCSSDCLWSLAVCLCSLCTMCMVSSASVSSVWLPRVSPAPVSLSAPAVSAPALTAQWKLLCPGKLRRVSECVARASHFVLPILCLANVLFKSDKWSPSVPRPRKSYSYLKQWARSEDTRGTGLVTKHRGQTLCRGLTTWHDPRHI